MDFLMNQSIFRRKGFNLPVILSVVLGILICTGGLYFNYHFALLGIILIGMPLVYDDWKFPKKVDFDYHNNLLKIKQSIFRKFEISYENINDIFLEHEVLRGQVSRFQEGNKDYVYKFFLKSKNGKVYRLISLKTRKDIMPQVQDLKKLLNYSSKLEDSNLNDN